MARAETPPFCCGPVLRLVLRLAGLALPLLAGCGDPVPERLPQSTPVSTLVAGVAPVPVRRLRGETPLSPEALIKALRNGQPPGVQLHVLPDDGPARLLFLTVELERFEPVILGVDGRGRGPSASDAIARHDAVLVIGSGFVANYQPLTPLGLLQVDGVERAPLQRHGYTRVLGLRAGRLGVVGRGEFHRGLFEAALQVGPGVIEASQLDINETELKLPAYLRSFVASCGSVALAGISLEPMHLYHLGRELLDYFPRAGLACDELVNLSGDREVVLALAPTSRELVYFGYPNQPKAALLAFRPSDKAPSLNGVPSSNDTQAP